MATPLDNVCCACIPPEALAVLSGLRCRVDIRVARAGDRVWLWWPEGRDEVLRSVAPIRGADLYERRGETWFRPGHSLPAFEVPRELTTRPLDHILTPAPLRAEPPAVASYQPTRVRLVRDEQPRATTALWCDADCLAAWADVATSHQLETLRAGRTERRILLLGARLPSIPGATRFWGERVLVPLGLRLEPVVPASALRAALGIRETELLFLTETTAEVVPDEALQPLRRSSLRLLLQESV